MNNNLDTPSTDKQGPFKNRDTDAKALKSEVAALSARLKELESAKERIKSFLQQELRKRTEAMRSKDSTIKELEQKLSRKAPLESQLSEKQELLKTRDAELKILRSEVASLQTRLSEQASGKERPDNSLQQEPGKKNEALRPKGAAVKEFDESANRGFEDLQEKLRESEALLAARDAEAEHRVQQLQQLLKARDTELGALRSEAIALSGRLAELVSAEARKEGSLYEELSMTKETLRAKESASEELGCKVIELQGQLSEKEKLLAARNKEIEKLAADLREKRLALAKEEIAVFQSMKRRNIWKRRFAMLRLPDKPH